MTWNASTGNLPNADIEALYLAAIRMADYLAEQFSQSLAANRESQLGMATAALARYQGWRSTLAYSIPANTSSGPSSPPPNV